MKPRYLIGERVLIEGTRHSDKPFWATVLDSFILKDKRAYEIETDDRESEYVLEGRIIHSEGELG